MATDVLELDGCPVEPPSALESADNDLTPIARASLATLFDEIKHLGERIDDLLYRMTELASEDPAHQRLQTIPSVGPVLAPIVLAKLGHAQQFKSGRDCAAWVGLVPKQMSTGGKTSLGGISKNGDRMLRTQLIHGARAVICVFRRCRPVIPAEAGHRFRRMSAGGRQGGETVVDVRADVNSR